MEPLFTVPTHLQDGAYAIFYQSAFVAGALLIFYEGYRRKWPLLPWLIVIGSCAVGAIIGSKLAVLSLEQLNEAVQHWRLPYSTQKTYLGGILGGMAGVYLARRWLGFRYSVLDAFAIAVPLALAIGRAGCLFSGCCFGMPANLPWAIAYETGSAPHFAHLSNGLIDSTAAASLPIHPTQIYESIFCLALALFLWKYRCFWKALGNLFYAQIILYGLFRFFTEFPRAGGTTILGLKYVQWELVSAVILVTGFTTFRERRWHLQPRTLAVPASILRKNLIAIAGIFLVLWIGMDWFTPLEMSLLKIFTLPILAGAGFELVQRLNQFRLSWAMAGMVLALPFLFAAKLENETPPDTAKSNYTTISAGAMHGRYQEENCNRITNHTYGVGGGGISHTQRFGEFNKLTYGIRGYLGTDKGDSSFSIRGINPYIQYDARWIGFGIGGHAGDLIFDGDPENLFPQAALRIGPYDKFFVEGRLADHFPGSWPDPLVKLGVGLGLKNEGFLRIGISSAGGNGTDLYVNPYIPLNGRFVIDPFLAYGSKSGQESYQLGLTLHYRFHR